MRVKITRPRLILSLVFVCALALVGPGQASAAQDCEEVTQYHAPIMVRQGPCVTSQSNYFWVDSAGEVLSGPGVTACALYTKVWRNHTLIANSVRNCRGLYASYYSPDWLVPVGTRATAQSWFDVRYRVGGGSSITERFESPRAVITVG